MLQLNVNYINSSAFIKMLPFRCHKSDHDPHLLTYFGNKFWCERTCLPALSLMLGYEITFLFKWQFLLFIDQFESYFWALKNKILFVIFLLQNRLDGVVLAILGVLVSIMSKVLTWAFWHRNYIITPHALMEGHVNTSLKLRI